MNPITLPVAELKPALTGLGKIVNRHAKLPVLGSVKVERSPDGWIALTSTDLDHFITVRLEQPGKGEPGALLVPFEELVKLARNGGKDEAVIVEPSGKELVTISHNAGQQLIENRVPTQGIEEFPPVPQLKGDSVPLPDPLRHAVHQAMQCASEDPTRYVLQGAFIDVSRPRAHHIIGTDGRHLYNANSWNLPLKNSVIIPKHRFLSWSEFNRDGEWQLKAEGPMLQINSRRWRFIAKQIEGNYPNWRQVLPDPGAARSHIVLDPAVLDKLVQTIGRMPCDNPEHFTIGIEWKDQRLTLLGRPPGTPDWTRVMINEVKGDGGNVTVFLNRQLLGKALEFGLNSVGIIDSSSPIRFHQGSREMIVMPIAADTSAAASPPPRQTPRIEAKRPVNGNPVNGAPHPAPARANRPVRAPRPRVATPPRIDEAMQQIGSLRESFRAGLAGLRDLATKLKLIKTSHQATEKEVEAVRSKVRSLQNIKL